MINRNLLMKNATLAASHMDNSWSVRQEKVVPMQVDP